MTPGHPSVVISGAGVACAVGTGCEALWEALATGRDGLRPIERFSVSEFQTKVAGLWPAWVRARPEDCSALTLAHAAAREAWANARVADSRLPPERVAVILGTCFGERCAGFSELTEEVATALGARGPSLTVSTACSSSTTAIGLGRDLIEERVADLVVAGGVDVLSREVFAGFHALGALSVDKCAPFGEPAGTSLAEGAGFVVLEAAERARARGLEPLCSVLGYGLSADAYHETAPDPSGAGIVRAIQAALADAAASAEEIDLVSAHGTGTSSNDGAEWRAIRAALGPVADHTPVTATKSFLGHAQGAAGVLEIVAALLCAQRGLIPPSLRAYPPRPGAPLDPVPLDRPRAHEVRNILKISAAFGGANAALLLSRHPRQPRPRSPRRKVRVAGIAAVGPHGLDVADLQAALGAQRRVRGRVPPFDLGRVVRSAPPRNVDPSGRYLSAAAAIALADARITVRGTLRDRAGIFTGTSHMPAQSADECRRSIERRGITAVAAVPFTHMVLNAPAGTAAKILSLKGPLLVLSSGAGSGLLAIVRAAEHLASHPSADLLVAGGHDELPISGDEELTEGAAVAVLTSGFDSARHTVELEGWGLSGAYEPNEAISRALTDAPDVDGVFVSGGILAHELRGRRRIPPSIVDVDATFDGARSAASAVAFALAVTAVRQGRARRLLVVAGGSALCCAAVIAAAEGRSDGR